MDRRSIGDKMTLEPMQKKRSNLRRLVAIVAALAAISFFAWWTAKRADLQMRADLLQQAKLVSVAADMEYVAALSGTEKDMDAPGFSQLKDQLTRARKVNPKCRFLYLLGQKQDGTVFFFLDTEPADYENYSPPGQAYTEAPDRIRGVFENGLAVTVGLYTDRWGTWISAFIPIADKGTGRVTTVLGMDMDAKFWEWEVARRCALPVGLTAFVLFLILFIVMLNRNHRLIRAQEKSIRESEQKLRNII